MKPVRPTIVRGQKATWDASSFGAASSDALRAHLERNRYGEFLLTGAIRPAFDLAIVPRSGYRIGRYRDDVTGDVLPTVSVSASAEYLFDLFCDLVAEVGDEVAVVLESSHDPDVDGHVDLVRDEIENVILRSILCDYEDLLLNDGYTGIAVLNPAGPTEVQLDEHKLIFIYAPDITPYRAILDEYGIPCDPGLRLISEGEHLHLSDSRFRDEFERLRLRLGVE